MLRSCVVVSCAANYGVVILAAGSSRRMGRPKLLLPWGATSILEHQIRTWRELGAGQVAVVWNPEHQAIEEELDRLDFPARDRIPNSKPEEGMFRSIQCAARWNGWAPGLTHWAISLGDQPQIRRETLETVLCSSATNPKMICQPRWQGELKHPVVLPKEVFALLASATTSSFKDFLHQMTGEVLGCDVADRGLALDIDEPADYEKAKSMLHRQAR